MQEEENLANFSLTINGFQKEMNCVTSFHVLFTEASQTAISNLKNVRKCNPIIFSEERELEHQSTALVTINENKIFSMCGGVLEKW